MVPSPLVGEGQGEGGLAVARLSPPPQPSPVEGEGIRMSIAVLVHPRGALPGLLIQAILRTTTYCGYPH